MIRRALATKGIASPAENSRSIIIPLRTEPCCEARIRAEPKNALTQGVQLIEKTIPNRIDFTGFNASVRITVFLPMPIMGKFIIPRKLNPKIIIINPDTKLKTVPCFKMNWPSVPAKAPNKTKTRVKPNTKPKALYKTLFLVFVISPAAK